MARRISMKNTARPLLPCPELEEIIFALDGDDSGRKATVAAAKILQTDLYDKTHDIKYSTITLPQGEDVNSVLVGHGDARGLFTKLFGERTTIELPPLLKKEKQPETDYDTHTQTLPLHTSKNLNIQTSKNLLNTEDPLNLVFITAIATYSIRGGLKYSLKDMDSLRVTLVVENRQGRQKP